MPSGRSASDAWAGDQFPDEPEEAANTRDALAKIFTIKSFVARAKNQQDH